MSEHLERAWKLYELKRDALAIEETQRHLAQHPHDAEALRLQAHAAARLGQVQLALTAARAAVAQQPDYAHMHFALSVAQKAASDRRSAEQSIREALRLDPEEACFYAFLANLLIQLKRSSEAMPVIAQGLALEPDNSSLLFSHPLAMWAMERPAEARRLVDEGLQRCPTDSNLHALKGALLTERGQGGDAIVHLLESLRIDPENTWAHKKLREAKGTIGIRGVVRRGLRMSTAFTFSVVCVVAFVLIQYFIRDCAAISRREGPTPEQLRFREAESRSSKSGELPPVPLPAPSTSP